MWNKFRTAIAPSVVVVLAAYGFAYAATGSPNPINLVSHHATSHVEVSPDPSDSPEASESPEAPKPDDPAESPEASHTPKPEHTPKASHGPVRSTVGCPDGFSGNHGRFVSQSDDHEAAAHSDCGKPEHPEASPSSSPTEVEHGHGDRPEPSESPEGSDNGEQHGHGTD